MCGDSPERVGSFLQCSRHRRRCSLGGGQAVVQAVGESGHSCFPNFEDCVNMLWFPWSAQGSQNQCCYSVVDICPYSFFQNTSHDEDGVVVRKTAFQGRRITRNPQQERSFDTVGNSEQHQHPCSVAYLPLTCALLNSMKYIH